ncbi:MAG: glycosyltransferase [bacterium]
MEQNKFIIITPAYNEEKYIETTIKSVLSQTILPLVWVIVNDGSSDGTAEIIQAYSQKFNWIIYVHRKKDLNVSYYASNVYAINKGYETAKGLNLNYEYLAILDADIELPMDYYEKILNFFSSDSKLGMASGHCLDRMQNGLKRNIYDWRSLPKNITVFRKQCYDDINGFMPLKYAGEDTCACFSARMKGWKTWSTTNLMVIHNKPLGLNAIAKGKLNLRFKQGISEYFIATHPVFMILKSIKRALSEDPYIIGGLSRFIGFLYAHFLNEKRQISKDLRKYIRKEQFNRIFGRMKKHVPNNDNR